VVLADVDIEAAGEVARELEGLGAGTLALKTDVSSVSETAEMAARSVQEFGRVDILVNDAAWTRQEFKLFSQTEPSDWEPDINITFRGVLNCCKAVIPYMIDQKAGRIINITSDASKSGRAGARVSLYAACKAGVRAFSRVLANELARDGILVNCVSPGAMTTGHYEGLSPEAIEKLVRGIPLKRRGEPEEVADAVLFFAGDESRYVTGQELSVSGGGAD